MTAAPAASRKRSWPRPSTAALAALVALALGITSGLALASRPTFAQAHAETALAETAPPQTTPKMGPPLLPLGLDPRQVESPLLRGALIALGTFILEDPTLAAVGLMIREGWLSWTLGLSSLFAGIFLGDLGLWYVGRRWGRRVLQWKRVAAWLPPQRAERFGGWIDRHTARVVLASRFVPGARLPVYLAAGAVGRRPWAFVGATLLAVALWVPVMTALATLVGGAAATKLDRLGVPTWLAVLLAFVLVLAAIHFLPRAPTLFTPRGRAGFVASVSKLWRWEFWPPPLFYAPFIPAWCLLAIRHGGLTVFARANPALPALGGLVLESKHALQAKFHGPQVLPTALLPPASQATLDQRLDNLAQAMSANAWAYPIVLKPDVGQRGVGVQILRSQEDARHALAAAPASQVLQPYDPGPCEAGVFYVRLPSEPRGRIFSITHKRFPRTTGDGQRTLEQLIWADKRLRMQARMFLRRLGPEAAERIPANDEEVALGAAGNHAQGAKFTDGKHLATDALLDAVEGIARRCDGFYFGRLDVRYTDAAALRAGAFQAVEVNGAASESTHLYDPSFSLFQAYRILWDQWDWAFRIGREVLQANPAVARPNKREAVSLLWRAWFAGAPDVGIDR